METQKPATPAVQRALYHVNAAGVRIVRLTTRQAAARAVWERKGRERAERVVAPQ